MGNIFMIIRAILAGLFMGLVIAIPVGPAGLEAVKRTVSKGYKEGLLVSVGSVAADTFDVLLINFGLFSLLGKNPKTSYIFWIVCGCILSFLGYISIKRCKLEKDIEFKPNLLKNKNIKSMPIATGFFIGLSNPLTHTLWITLSGTVIRIWEGRGKYPYYTFIFCTLFGMLLWLALLNYLALKGYNKINSEKTSKLINLLLGWCIFGLGFIFISYGALKLAFYL